MDSNPYASPTIDADDDVSLSNHRRRGPLAMAVSGFFAGGFIGATAGALAAGTLGLLVAISSMAGLLELDQVLFPDEETELAIIVTGAIFGTILGGFSGCVIGPVAGLVSAYLLASQRRSLAIGTAIALSLAGVAGGLLEGAIIAHDLILLGGGLWVLIGAFLGIGFGAVGGYILGRGLGIIAWGKIDKEVKE